MRKILSMITVLLSVTVMWANDGVYYASGNQLIPITDTDISVRKEVLSLKRVGDYVRVTVDYVFFNSAKAKDVLVGFEAAPPYPLQESDVKEFPNQPHISNFSVLMNGKNLPYEIAVIENEECKMEGYYKNGKFNNVLTKSKMSAKFEEDDMWQGFYYVYHFKAHFVEGENTIRHTYNYALSSGICEEYYLPYILTAANRWSNKQIDDFTLVIDMGQYESFTIDPTFFNSVDEWQLNGVGRKGVSSISCGVVGEGAVKPIFHIQEGSISFHKKNFHPQGELYVTKSSIFWFYFMHNDEENAPSLDGFSEQQFSLKVAGDEVMQKSKFTAEQRQILRNLPFAYRGYMFKNKNLIKFFNATKWYVPNEGYKSDLELLTEDEKRWVMFWKD